MPKRIFIMHRDYCPYLGENHSIRVEYVQYSVLGDPSARYRDLGFSCDYENECGLRNDCPVCKSTPSRPI